MSDFKAKMHPIRFRLGLCSRPRWGSLQRSPDPLAGFKGPTSKGKGGKGSGGKGSGAHGKKVKERIVLREIHLRTTGVRHLSMGSHSVICHPTDVTAPPSPQPGRLVLDLSTP